MISLWPSSKSLALQDRLFPTRQTYQTDPTDTTDRIDQTDQIDQIPFFVQVPVIFCTQSSAQHPKDPFDSNKKIVHNTFIHLKIDISQRIMLSIPFTGTQLA